MYVCMNGCMDAWMRECVDEWRDGAMKGRSSRRFLGFFSRLIFECIQHGCRIRESTGHRPRTRSLRARTDKHQQACFFTNKTKQNTERPAKNQVDGACI